MRRHICGTPREGCTGTLSTVDKEGIGTHATAQEAFECHRRFLISRGFVPVGMRELIDPADGCVRVLTKNTDREKPSRAGLAPPPPS